MDLSSGSEFTSTSAFGVRVGGGQTEGRRLGLSGEGLLWRGRGQAGNRLLAPLQLQIILCHKHPVGDFGFGLARLSWRAWEEERHPDPAAIVCPERDLPTAAHPSPGAHTPIHAYVCCCTWLREGSVADGGSRWQLGVQEVKEGGTSTGLNVPGFRPPGKPTLGLQLFTQAA